MKPKHLRWLVALLSVGLLFIGLSRAHHRDVTRGSFRGFEIEMSKMEAYQRIDEIGTNAISSFNPNYQASFSAVEFQEFDFGDAEGIGVGDFGLSGMFFFADGRVFKIVARPESENEIGIKVGDSKSQVRDKLTALYQKRPHMSVSTQLRGHGPNFTDWSAGLTSPLDAEEREWLFEKDTWSFRPYGSYKNFYLTFENDRLTRIEYYNYFVDLP